MTLRASPAGPLFLFASFVTATLLGACSSPARGPQHLEEMLAGTVYENLELPDVAPTVRTVLRGHVHRRSLSIVADSSLTFTIDIPAAARLHVALAAATDGAEVTFRVRGGDDDLLFEDTVADTDRWHARSIDLSSVAGRDVTLRFETSSPRAGAEALWGAPVVSSGRRPERPNVIFYVIDAAGSDYMSLYGHERKTTPFLEELAREGTVFDSAFSNSTWTKISTPSFLTSLQSSVMGGYHDDRDRVPDAATPLPEILHNAGYQTASFTSNPFAGTMTGLERGLDLLRDAGVPNHSTSSQALHADFLAWRDEFPAQPYWVHFQTTDVHWPWRPEAPFAGRYVTPEERERFYEWEVQLAEATGIGRPQWLHAWRYPPAAFEQTGIDRRELFDIAARLYDECMLHADAQLRALVLELERRGEWGNTILIVASDHGNAHGIGMLDDIPPRSDPIMGSIRTRIPLLVVWPSRVRADQRVQDPVSMLDILPTVVDLLGMPPPPVAQGHSLAPVLRGEPWEPSPVVLDEMYVAEDGSISGWLEIVDGRWGASWQISDIGDRPIAASEVVLCDLQADPLCRFDVASDRPDETKRLAADLTARWQAHRALATQFGPSDPAALTPEQLSALRALGYIQ